MNKIITFPPFYFFTVIIFNFACYFLFPEFNSIPFPCNLVGIIAILCGFHMANKSSNTFTKKKKCILIWGHNPKATHNAFRRQIKAARKKGAKVIVVDPRRTEIAAKADLWLPVKPATDGALALGMIHLMIKHKLFDDRFVRNWTNAPLLVRNDTGDLLRVSSVDSSEKNQDLFYLIDPGNNQPVPSNPGDAWKEYSHLKPSPRTGG